MLLLLVSGVLFVVHASLFGSWLIDDAGVSFAYSRNLIAGHGLVAQPGALPVEGYSNFAWVVLLAPLFGFTTEATVAVKLISTAFVLAGFLCLTLTLRHYIINPWTRGIPCIALALTTPFVIWTTSGLENPLYFLLAVLLFSVITRNLVECRDFPSRRLSVAAGVLAVLLALTRPDGMLFLGLYPAAVVVIRGRKLFSYVGGQDLAVYCFTAIVLFGSFLAFRYGYFGHLLPNTHYSKALTGESDYLLNALLLPGTDQKPQQLIGSIVYLWRFWVLMLMLAGTCWLGSTGRLTDRYRVLLLFLLSTAFIYLMLPDDWMGEFRFATPFYPFFYAYAAWMCDAVRANILAETSRVRRLLLAGAFGIPLALVVVTSLFHFAQRSSIFADSPTVPYESIRQRAQLLNQAARMLGLDSASILTPDLGGMLMDSELHVIDLAGLTDSVIGQTYFTDDKTGRRDYILGQTQPELIHLHSTWTDNASLELDLRFRRDYEPICEYPERYMGDGHSITLYSGVFIRRELNAASHKEWDQIVRLVSSEVCGLGS